MEFQRQPSATENWFGYNLQCAIFGVCLLVPRSTALFQSVHVATHQPPFSEEGPFVWYRSSRSLLSRHSCFTKQHKWKNANCSVSKWKHVGNYRSVPTHPLDHFSTKWKHTVGLQTSASSGKPSVHKHPVNSFSSKWKLNVESCAVRWTYPLEMSVSLWKHHIGSSSAMWKHSAETCVSKRKYPAGSCALKRTDHVENRIARQVRQRREESYSFTMLSANSDNQQAKNQALTLLLECLESCGRQAASQLPVNGMYANTKEDVELKLRQVRASTPGTQSALNEILEYFVSSNQILLTRRSVEQIAKENNWSSLAMAFYAIKNFDGGRFSGADAAEKEKAISSGMGRWDERRLLVSDVIVVSVSEAQSVSLADNVTLIIRHSWAWSRARRARCVFWDMPVNAWSSRGCQTMLFNTTHSHCQCQHLSSFALVFNVAMTASNSQNVGQITLTFILLPISIMGLTVTIVTYSYFKNLKSARNTVHIHMLSCLLAGQTLFLLGIHLSHVDVLCTLITFVMHFSFLTAFFWMFVEGVHVYLMLIQPTSQRRQNNQNIRVYYTMCGFAYGVPMLIVCISAGLQIEGYGTPLYCWLSTENGLIWSFVGPALVIISLNSVLLALAIFVMCKHSRTSNAMRNRSFTAKLKVWVRGVVTLIILLGIPFIFGIFHLNEDSVFFSYIFIYLNGIQGGFIFVFHCLANDKVMAEYRRKLRTLLAQSKVRIPEWLRHRFALTDTMLAGTTFIASHQDISDDRMDPLEGLLTGWEGPHLAQFFSSTQKKSKGRKVRNLFGFFFRKLYGSSNDNEKSEWVDYYKEVLGETIVSAFRNDSPVTSVEIDELNQLQPIEELEENVGNAESPQPSQLQQSPGVEEAEVRTEKKRWKLGKSQPTNQLVVNDKPDELLSANVSVPGQSQAEASAKESSMTPEKKMKAMFDSIESRFKEINVNFKRKSKCVEFDKQALKVSDNETKMKDDSLKPQTEAESNPPTRVSEVKVKVGDDLKTSETEKSPPRKESDVKWKDGDLKLTETEKSPPRKESNVKWKEGGWKKKLFRKSSPDTAVNPAGCNTDSKVGSETADRESDEALSCEDSQGDLQGSPSSAPIIYILTGHVATKVVPSTSADSMPS